MSKTKHSRRNERGQSLAEFAIILPLLLIILAMVQLYMLLMSTMLSLQIRIGPSASKGFNLPENPM